MKGDLEGMCTKAFMAYCKGWSKENHNNP